MLSPRTRNLKHNSLPTPRDKYPNVPVISLIDFNISGTNDTPCTLLPVKSNSGPQNGTNIPNAPVTPAKRDNYCTTQFSSVSATIPTIIAVVLIRNSAPPLSKIGRNTTNNPSNPYPNSDLQVRGLLLRRARLDAHQTD